MDYLLSFAWLLWLVWMYQAPLPHLRYLWPALASFAILSGAALAWLHVGGAKREEASFRIPALLTALSCLVFFYGASLRAIVFGEGDLMSFEWAGRSALHHYDTFEYPRHQERMAAYLMKAVAEDEEVVHSLGPGLG